MKSRFFAVLLGIAILTASVGAASVSNAAAAAQESKARHDHVFFDKQFYSMGQKGKVTIIDKNLDKRHDAIDSYKPVQGFVSLEVNKKKASSVFVDKLFRTSFRETGPHTGVFQAVIKIPTTDDAGATLKGKSLTIRYNDIHNQMVWQDTVVVR